MTERIGHWVTTFTGGRWWPHDPRPGDVRAADLAALAQACRFGGATSYQWPDWRRGRLAPYTVAEHSCRVHDLVADWVDDAAAWPEYAYLGHEGKRLVRLCALCHDGHEAYPPGDQLSPTLRHDCEETRAVKAMSRRAADAFRAALGLPLHMPEIVKRADLTLLATEKRDLMPPDGEGWGDNGRALPPPLPRRIEVWDPEHAREAFFRRLRDCAPDLCEGL